MTFEKIRDVYFRFLCLILPIQTVVIFSVWKIDGIESPFVKTSLYFWEIGLVLYWVFIFFILREFFEPFLSKVLRFGFAVGFLLISISQFPNVTAGVLIHLFSGLLWFILLLHEKKRIKNAINYFFIGIAISSLFGIFQFFTSHQFENSLLGISFYDAKIKGVSVIVKDGIRHLRSYGTFAHPNIFGGYLVFTLFLLLFFKPFLFKNSKHHFFYFLILLLYFFTSLLLTFSRSSWLSFSFLLFSFFILNFKNIFKIIFNKKKFLYFTSLLLYFSTSVFLLHPFVTTRFSSDAINTRSVFERTVLTKQALIQFKQFPFFGSGLGTFPLIYQKNIQKKPLYEYQPVHNIFLLLLCEIGIIPFLILCFFSFKRFLLWEIQKKKLFLAYFCVFFPVLFFDHYLLTQYSGNLLFAMVFASFFLLTDKDFLAKYWRS